jgi:hypothetical protein
MEQLDVKESYVIKDGDLHLYRIQSTEEEPYTIEYYLDK